MLLTLLMFLCLAINALFAKPMVYDCFLFLNELEILDIRLHEMNAVVDKFVIVESIETFRGNPKPFNLENNWNRFEEFEEKIIYVKLDTRFMINSPWDRETYQRNQIMLGLVDCQDDDIILISDVDEIVEEKGVAQIGSILCKEPNQYVGVSQEYHSNFLNSLPSSSPWQGTVATTFAILKKTSPQAIRNMRDLVPSVARGWHFTWQGGVAADLYKLGAYSHAESDTPEGRASKCVDKSSCPVVKIDETYPRYVIENQDYFEKIGFILKPK